MTLRHRKHISDNLFNKFHYNVYAYTVYPKCKKLVFPERVSLNSSRVLDDIPRRLTDNNAVLVSEQKI